MKKLIIVIALLCVSALAQTYHTPTLERDNTFTGTNTFGTIQPQSVNGWKYASRYADLQTAINAAGTGGRLMVDQSYTGLTGITLPRLFTMECKGPQAVSLSFTNTSGSSVTVTAGGSQADYVIIRNCNFLGPNSGTSKGIDLTNAGFVWLENDVVRQFSVGVYGSATISVWSINSNVSVNTSYNYQLASASNSWHIVGGVCSQAGTYGIYVQSANNTVIDGVRMESNALAIYNAGTSTSISNNRFELNNLTNDAAAADTHLSGNYYSTASFTDNGTGTVRTDSGRYARFGSGMVPGNTPAPTCDASHRGVFWYVPGGAGVKDVVEVCGKDNTDTYAWRSIY